jgi:DNA ligase 1
MVMLAKKYDGHIPSPAGWYMSEKLDGVRAVWDGSQLKSRAGKIFSAPKWFTDSLPAEMLDGELWLGRGQFQKTVSIVRKKKPVDEEWRKVLYCVFATPRIRRRFYSKIRRMKKLLKGNEVAIFLPHLICKGHKHFSDYFEYIINRGGEGIMLRSPGSFYKDGRSDDLLKYKPHNTDEAVVKGYQSGKKRCENMVGALLCKFKGKNIKIGVMSDEVRVTPPPIGSVVSFKCFGFTDSGSPRFPIYLTERNYE